MLNLTTQHKLGVFQGLVVEQPVQVCPLCRGVPYSSSIAMQINKTVIMQQIFHEFMCSHTMF